MGGVIHLNIDYTCKLSLMRPHEARTALMRPHEGPTTVTSHSSLTHRPPAAAAAASVPPSKAFEAFQPTHLEERAVTRACCE